MVQFFFFFLSPCKIMLLVPSKLLGLMRGSTCIYAWIADTESDLTEIVNRVQKSTHEAVIRVEV